MHDISLLMPIPRRETINTNYRWDVFIKIEEADGGNNFVTMSRAKAAVHKYQLSWLHPGEISFVIRINIEIPMII